MGRLLRSLPALVWASATLAMATSMGAHGRTGGWLLPLLQDTLGLTPATAEVAHVLVRKAGHVLAYGIFAALVWWAQPRGRRRIGLALGLALALAVADESLQAFAAEREGSPLDVLVDLAGASLAVFFLRRRAQRRVRAT